MKKLDKKIIFTFATLAIFGLFVSTPVLALSPSLGDSETYGILSSSFTNTTATTVNGSIGYTTGPATPPSGTHLYDGSGAPYSAAGTAQGSVLATLTSLACTHTFPDGEIDLSQDITHGAKGVYTPGVYCTTATSAASIGTPAGITLQGSGTFVFRIDGAFSTVANSSVTLAGASECDVFWTPSAATTLGANSTFAGTVIDAAGITVGANTVWNGRALAFGGTVSTDTATITNSCPVVVVTPPVVPVVPPVITPVVPPVVAIVDRHISSGSRPFPVVAQVSEVTTAPIVSPLVTPVATVIPKLPNTGFPPKSSSNVVSTIVIASVLLLGSLSLLSLKKKQLK